MDIYLVLLFSITDKVIGWQLKLGIVQVIGRVLGGEGGLLFAAACVALWTFAQTSGGLLIFQLIVQAAIFKLLIEISNDI